MVLRSENGYITYEILTDIFQTLDIYDLILCQPGLTPFALMDAYRSRIELPLLEYINKPEKNGPSVLVSLVGPPCGKLVIRKSKADRTKLR